MRRGRSRGLLTGRGMMTAALALVVALSGCAAPASRPAATPLPVATAGAGTVAEDAATRAPEPAAVAAETATATPAVAAATETAVATAAPTLPPLAARMAEGEAALARSDFAAAETAYRQALALDPGHAPAQTGLAWTYSWQMGRGTEALAAAAAATELDGKNAAAWAALAHVHTHLWHAAEAVAAGRAAVEADPKNAPAQAALAGAYVLDLRHAAALEAARTAVKLDPGSAYAYDALARVHAAMADYGRSRAALEQAIALQPDFAPWQVDLGALYWAHGFDYAARTAYDRALKRAPDYPPALLGKASVRTYLTRAEETARQIARAAELAPGAVEPLLDWGNFYLEQELVEPAMARFKAAAELAPGDWRPLAAQAEAKMWQGECDNAARLYQNLIADHPRVAALRIQAGWARQCLGEASRSLELARAALELDPYNWEAHGLLGRLLAEQERWEESRDSYLTALRYTLRPADVHGALGEVYLYQGDLERAEAEYARAVRLDANAVAGLNGLCTVAWWQTRPEKMLEPCAQAALLVPYDPEIALHLGIAAYLNDRYDDAVAALQANLERNPEHALSHFYLGLAYLRRGEYAAASKPLAAYRKLVGEEDYRVPYLADAAAEGWELREAAALALLRDESRSLTGRGSVTWKVERAPAAGGKPGAGALVATLRAGRGEDPEQVYGAATGLLMLASLVAPRISPALKGGAVVRATDAAGAALFTVEATAEELWLYLGGDLDDEQFDERIDFVLPADGLRSAELTDKLVADTAAEVAELRELKPKEPFTSERMDQEALDAYLAEVHDDEAREEIEADDLLLTLLGALDSHVDLFAVQKSLQSEQIVGFYDDEDQVFYVVTDKSPGLGDRTTAAHEYVHVLQDQHFGIGAARDEIAADDAAAAYRALIEGDASLVTAMYMDQLPAIEMLQTSEASLAGSEEWELARAPGLIREWVKFPHESGFSFVWKAYERGGWDAVNELYENPPTSTEQVLHPERYRAGDEPVEMALPDLAETLGDEWRVVDENNQGELGWRLVLSELVGPTAAERAAEGWGGDRYVLLRDEAANCRLESCAAALLTTAWDTLRDAEEFWATLRIALENRTGFDEVVPDLAGTGLARHFRGKEASQEIHWIVQVNGQAVTVAIAPTAAEAGALLAAIQPGGVLAALSK